jgi:hypothetical protein
MRIGTCYEKEESSVVQNKLGTEAVPHVFLDKEILVKNMFCYNGLLSQRNGENVHEWQRRKAARNKSNGKCKAAIL